MAGPTSGLAEISPGSDLREWNATQGYVPLSLRYNQKVLVCKGQSWDAHKYV